MGEGLWFEYPQSSHIGASLADRTPFWLKRLFPTHPRHGLEVRRPDVGLLLNLGQDGGARPRGGLERRGGRIEAPCGGWHDAVRAACARSLWFRRPIPSVWGVFIILLLRRPPREIRTAFAVSLRSMELQFPFKI